MSLYVLRIDYSEANHESIDGSRQEMYRYLITKTMEFYFCV